MQLGRRRGAAKSLKMCRLESGQRRLSGWSQMGLPAVPGSLHSPLCSAPPFTALPLAWLASPEWEAKGKLVLLFETHLSLRPLVFRELQLVLPCCCFWFCPSSGSFLPAHQRGFS